jgi:hypothetical protein
MARVSRLKAEPPKAVEPSKPKVLIYGRPNVGKTWTSMDFPRCYYIDTEGGANLEHYVEKLDRGGGMYLGPDKGANDFDTVLDQIQGLAIEEHQFRTLVIDSVSHLFSSEVATTQEQMDSAHEKDEYGASNRPATRKMRRIINWIDKLDMNVILVAHEKDEYGVVNGKRDVIGKTFDCWAKIEYILHLALHITRDTDHWARVRKTRLLGFPYNERFHWSYEEFAQRYGRDIIESEVKRFAVVTPEELRELNDLMERVKMPDDWLEKSLKYAKVEQIEDLSSEDLQKMIKKVKERIGQ